MENGLRVNRQVKLDCSKMNSRSKSKVTCNHSVSFFVF